MFNMVNLMLYMEESTSTSKPLLNLINKCDISFKYLDNMSHLFSVLKNTNIYAILYISSPNILTCLLTQKNLCNYKSRIFIVHNHLNFKNQTFNNCNIQNLVPVREFLNTVIKPNNVTIKLKPPTLINKLIRLELDNLGVLKKYVGFKYLADIIEHAICNNILNAYNYELLEFTASINLTTLDSVERDIRHILLTTYKNSAKFKSAINSTMIANSKINSKNILNNLIKYLKLII